MVEQCTVAILCEGYAVIKGDYNTGRDCNKGYLTLSDGSYGESGGCGKADFRDIPRIPRNGGSDMFVEYRGRSNSSCFAVCIENFKPTNTSQVSSKRKHT